MLPDIITIESGRLSVKLDIIDHVTQPGSRERTNEDTYGHKGNTAWVIDAAGGLGNRRYIANDNGHDTDAAWLAHRLSLFFRNNAPAYGGDLAGLLVAARQNLSHQFNAAARAVPMAGHNLPVAAVTLLHADAGNGVKIARLGDTVAMVQDSDYRIDGVFDNPVLRQAEARTLAAKRKGDDLVAVQRANRANANGENGFGVFALRDHFAPLITQKHIPDLKSGQALLMSDGFYRLVDVFGLYDNPALMGAVQHRGLAPQLDRLRKLEHRRDSGQVKPSDDATAMFLRIDRK